jgi:hypothetical protein
MYTLFHVKIPLFRMIRSKAPTIRTLKYITRFYKLQYLFSNF